MATELAIQTPAALLESVVVGGNLANLSASDRLKYYSAVCESVGLNPLTRPFEYITLNNKLTLYAKRDATDQLRAIHGVSIEKLEREVVEGIYTVTAQAKDNKGRVDTSLGAVAIEGLKGEARANAMMKAETKAKRRVTLSICGLGLLDETEVETIPGAVVGEPEMVDQDALDRKLLLEQIRAKAGALGMSKADGDKLWAQIVGTGVKPSEADLGKMLTMVTVLDDAIRDREAKSSAETVPF